MMFMHKRIIVLFTFFCFLYSGGGLWAQTDEAKESLPATAAEPARALTKEEASIKMLLSIVELKKNIRQRILEKQTLLKKTKSEAEKASLKGDLDKLDKDLSQATFDFERMATGVDVGLFAEKKEKPFDWKDELVSLMKPGIMELKRLTVKARYKSKLKDELTSFETLASIAGRANENLKILVSKTKDSNLKKQLKRLTPEWEGVEHQIRNRLEIVQMELNKMAAEETSLIDSSRESIKNFFRTRGLFLFIALLSCVCLVLFLRLIHSVLRKIVPGYALPYRPFYIRVMDLAFRVLALVLALVVMVLVFYIFEDWVLLSLTIIFMAGLGWTAKNTLPKYWHQGRLILNIGAVREGERLLLNGIPWLVKNINVFSTLVNPDLGITLRVPIEELMDKASRSFHKKEPWFPCRKNDWVILSDGTRGGVVSLSHEMVELVLRGGARKVYQTHDFLSLTPLNLSVNFRIKTLFGISYEHQAEATGKIPGIIDAYIREQIQKEGYKDSLLNLKVEFAQAGASSLDFVVISDFKGEMAPLYNRLSRAVQRWCVDVCTQNNWDIPFPQLMVHRRG